MSKSTKATLSRITNRGPESGGSIGGNMKPGLVNNFYFSMIKSSVLETRVAGACCRVPPKPKTTSSTSTGTTTNPMASYS